MRALRSPVVASAVSIVALVVALAALILATLANRRWVRRPGRFAHAVPAPDPRIAELADQFAGLREQAGRLEGEVGDLAELVRALGRADSTTLRNVAIVRYDAFADVGGRLSYSLAVLDDTATGFVLTTLAGKSDVRTYVRTVTAGTGDGTLTAEEQQAIEAAVGSQP